MPRFGANAPDSNPREASIFKEFIQDGKIFTRTIELLLVAIEFLRTRNNDFIIIHNEQFAQLILHVINEFNLQRRRNVSNGDPLEFKNKLYKGRNHLHPLTYTYYAINFY